MIGHKKRPTNVGLFYFGIKDFSYSLRLSTLYQL